jgi:hypothetical protein
MFTALQIRERMKEQPFKPFRICMSDGRTFDVTNHDMAFVQRNTVRVGIDLDSNSFAERYAECAIMHITSIDDIPTAQAA